MAANIEQLARVEQKLAPMADGDPSSPELAALLHEYRAACENITSADFEHAASAGIETRLWDVHLKINANYRKLYRHLKRNSKDCVVEIRKMAKNYLQFIKGSQRFYRQSILNLDAQFDGIPELRKLAQTWKDDTSKTALRKGISASLKTQVLESCHQTLIHLGDLSRYRETELNDKERNWGPAKGYYDLAADIYPDSGHAHNQLAVLSGADGNHFRSTYHLYRSLASKKPHPLAKQNLELEFKKIVSAWNKGELIINHKTPSDSNNTARALVAWFIRLHSKCYKGEEFAQHDELESEVLSHLAIELKERPLDHILQKIILINLAAEYFAIVQMQSPDAPENIMRTYYYYLRLNVKTFFTLLQLLQLELERLSEGDDVTHQDADRSAHLSDKITAVARRILPGLRLYSTWFTRYWQVLNANVADTLTTVEVQELWKAYAATLTLIASSFPPQALPRDNYMLEEDTETIGFQPLVSPDTMRLWYNDSETDMKPKWSEIERNHPNVEMLMRIRDFLVDGLTLTQKPEVPLELDGLRFIYREEGLPSELLASPNNRADDCSPVLSPGIPTGPVDFPLFPEPIATEAPIPDDQQSYSVAPPSESASTTIAKDSAMNRMVDDLVGPDEGLDPLPEEDENVPPTPPAQTFEDTALVTDSTYGLGSITISDIVNTVQNYKKLPVSPVPVQAMFATPMARVASSSSIRQPVNLPSLPDGQYSGNSIWNRNYNGTPGPSSPLLGNGFEARESPLDGMRSSGMSGHVRGDSSNSLRSSDFPVQRPLSGGLGSGADWGNPNSSSNFGPIYGNSYNGYSGTGYQHSQYGSTANMSLASPLWGKGGPWNVQVHEPYSHHTPPNGQAG